MKQKKNILFSTTRQWNPGDEFILFGILNIFRSIDDNFNTVIFNRNPEIQRGNSDMCFNFQIDFSRMRIKRLKSGFYDNSFKVKFLKDPFIDLIVFAGTPEWASPRLRSMYAYIEQNSILTIYLGIGSGDPDFTLNQLNTTYRRVLKKAKLITVRDKLCQELLLEFNPILLPGPSLFAASRESEKNIKKVQKVGLIYASDKSVKSNRINYKTYSFMKEFYKRFLEKYTDRFEIEFICHYIDALRDFYQDFDSWECHYSYDAGNYIDIYSKFDFIIGPRVHGIGLAASLGIPGIHIQHDIRGVTCEGFHADVVKDDYSYEDIFELFDAKVKRVHEINEEILEHKHKSFQKYQDLLTPILKPMLAK